MKLWRTPSFAYKWPAIRSSSERRMVEAAGIEPASEDRATKTSTCLYGRFGVAHQTAGRHAFLRAIPFYFAAVTRAFTAAIPLLSALLPR